MRPITPPAAVRKQPSHSPDMRPRQYRDGDIGLEIRVFAISVGLALMGLTVLPLLEKGDSFLPLPRPISRLTLHVPSFTECTVAAARICMDVADMQISHLLEMLSAGD